MCECVHECVWSKWGMSDACVHVCFGILALSFHVCMRPTLVWQKCYAPIFIDLVLIRIRCDEVRESVRGYVCVRESVRVYVSVCFGLISRLYYCECVRFYEFTSVSVCVCMCACVCLYVYKCVSECGSECVRVCACL